MYPNHQSKVISPQPPDSFLALITVQSIDCFSGRLSFYCSQTKVIYLFDCKNISFNLSRHIIQAINDVYHNDSYLNVFKEYERD